MNVTFPGGASASATLLGTHRATVVVPAGATAGDLTATTDGVTLGPVAFRRASFALGIQQFQTLDEQATGARLMPALTSARGTHVSVVVGDWLYVIGGVGATNSTLDSVERAMINADGSLSSFGPVSSTKLVTPRQYLGDQSIVAGGFVYIVGGMSTGSVVLDTVERAPILPDGSLGMFMIVPGATLVHARYNHSAVVIGNEIYVIGGSTGSTFLDSVEAATIQPDGSVSAFQEVGHLTTAREAHMTVVMGDSLYVLGGDHTAGGLPAIGDIERAPITKDGKIGSFASVGSLATPRGAGVVWSVGHSVFVAAGNATSGLATTVERAELDASGGLGAFITLPGVTLSVKHCAPNVVGNFVYVTGGFTASSTSSAVVRASINTSGALGAPSPVASALTAPRDRFRIAVIGNGLYVIGGSMFSGASNDVPAATIEHAPVAPDGSLGAFSTVSSTSLVTPRDEPGIAVIGHFVYVIGGSQTGSGPFYSTVERATINDDGTIGPFATVAGVTLQTARNSFQTVVTGTAVYVIGGYTGSATLPSIERATINPDGSLGAFSTATPALQTGRNAFSITVDGRFVYVVGGCAVGNCPLAGIERASIAADGTLGAFTAQTATMASGGFGFPMIPVGATLYALGGYGPTTFAGSESSTFDASGSLAPFSNLPNVSLSSRVYAGGVALGNFLYVLGGQNGSSLASVEQSTLE